MDVKKYLIFFLFYSMVYGFINIDLINGFFKEKQIKFGIVIGCFPKTDQLKFTKELSLKTRVIILKINKINVTKAFKIDKNSNTGVILDSDCPQSDTVIKKCADMSFFNVKHHWLLLGTQKNVTQLFNNTKTYVNADIHVASPDNLNSSDSFEITDFYNPSSEYDGKYVYKHLGYFNKKEGYLARIKGGKFWGRRNFTGIKFKAMVVLPEPFEGNLLDYLQNDENRQINTFNRMHNSVMHVCKQYYNFSMDIYLSKSWGYLNPDKTFDGLVGALERKQMDFGLSPLFVRTDRAQYMEYGRRTWVLRAAFIFKNPKRPTSVEVFLEPLSTNTWLITLLSATVGILALRVSFYQEKVYLEDDDVDYSWSLLIISIVSAMCQQGFTQIPNLISGRIVMLFILILFLLIYQFYSGSIVSHLLMKDVTTIKTVRDILTSPLEAGCEDILYSKDYFKYTSDKDARNLYTKKIYKPNNKSNYLTAAQGVQLVEKGNYAFHVELATAYPIIDHSFNLKEVCELREVQLFRTQPMHSNLQKHSPYRDLFDTCLQKLASEGILDREIKHWHPRKPTCFQNSNAKTFNVGFMDIYPAIMTLGIGMILSFFVLFIEIQVHNKFKNVQKGETIVVYPFVN